MPTWPYLINPTILTLVGFPAKKLVLCHLRLRVRRPGPRMLKAWLGPNYPKPFESGGGIQGVSWMILTCKRAPVDNDEIDEDDNSESPPTKEELEKEKMNQQAKTQRKKAGLPELVG